MMLPRLLIPVLSLVVAQVISESDDTAYCPRSSPEPTCQRFNLTGLVSQIASDHSKELQSVNRRITKRQVGRAHLGGCGNAQLSQIMKHVVGPLQSVDRMKLGDIAQILQQSVQQATGKSFEVVMGKGEMALATHQMSETANCRLRIGDYYTIVYETPVQYNINDVRSEAIMANVDFGQPLGGSGYPGQTPFHRQLDRPHRQSVTNVVQDGPVTAGQVVERPLASGQQGPLTSSLGGPGASGQGSSAGSSQQISRVPVDCPEQFDYVEQAPPTYYAQSPIDNLLNLQNLLARRECFSGDLIVETAEGPKRMDELKMGDEVLSMDENTVTFSPILMFLHREEELLAEFNVITTESGYSLKLTNEHLIYVIDCNGLSGHRLVRAKEVTTEHCLIAARSSGRELETEQVVGVTKVIERGIYAPLTATGDIIVNNVLSSCHSNLAIRVLMDSFFAAYRFISRILPERGGDLPLGVHYFTSVVDLFIPMKAVLG